MSSWIKTDLALLIDRIESGGRPKGGVSEDSGDVPSLGGENIRRDGGLELVSVKRVPRSFFEKMSKGVLSFGDVLINKDGANTGKVGLYESEFPKASINEHLFLLRGNPDKLNQRFLYYLLLSQFGQAEIRSKISGSAQPGLKKSFISNFPIIVPESVEEQATIASVLAIVDRAIEQTEALIAKYRRIKAGLMHDLLTRGIDENGNLRHPSTHKFKESPLGLIPVGWEVNRLERLTLKIIDGTHHTPNYVDNGVPFVTVKNLTQGNGIDLSEVNFISPITHKLLYRRADPKPGDVLVTKDGTLGIARIVTSDLPQFSIFVSVALLRPDPRLCMPELIWAFFESGYFEPQLGYLSVGTGLRHIHLEHFRAFQIATPPLSEQQRIFQFLKSFEERLRDEGTILQKLQRLKAGLMQDLLTGRVSVEPLLRNGNLEEA